MKKNVEIVLPTGRERFEIIESMYRENLLTSVVKLLDSKKLYGEVLSEPMKLVSTTINLNNSKFIIDEINTDFGKAEAVIICNKEDLELLNSCELRPRLVKQNGQYKLITLDMIKINECVTNNVDKFECQYCHLHIKGNNIKLLQKHESSCNKRCDDCEHFIYIEGYKKPNGDYHSTSFKCKLGNNICYGCNDRKVKK